MKRNAEHYLQEWLTSKNRHPLIIRGARQVGKSTLVRDFAQSAGLQLNEINLYRHLDLAKVFRTLNPRRICEEISDRLSQDVQAGGLLFLDEIQAIPEAIDALRYFHEEMKELPVVSAGSLLEFTLARHHFSMPVGRVEYMFLGPVTFGEFVQEANPYLASYLTAEKLCRGLSDSAHGKLMELVRRFMLVGGMPEAVQTWLDTESMMQVSAVHRRVVNTYIDDFAKYATGTDLALMQNVFRQLPNQVGKKVKYVNYSREHKAAAISNVLELFIKARIACPVIHSSANGIPLGAEESPAVRKLLFLDVGLMNYANGLSATDILNMDDTRLINEGTIAEQFVGQHLFFRRGLFEYPRLNYWLREGSSTNAEVDYVIEQGLTVLPIEIKAGKAGTMKGLRQMMLEKKLTQAIRFDASKFDVQKVHIEESVHGGHDWTLVSSPLYGVEALCCPPRPLPLN